MYKLLTSILFISCLQANDLNFSVLTIEDGLPSNQINDLAQDEKGFLWIATGNGLVRYDGYSFRIFRNNPADERSLSGNVINSLYHGAYQGRPVVWVATESGGLSALQLETEEILNWQHQPNDAASLGSNWLMSIYQTDSVLWVGTNNNGLNQLDLETGRVRRFDASEQLGSIRDIIDDKRFPGEIFLATTEGVFSFNVSSRRLKPVALLNNKLRETSGVRVEDLYFDDQGNLWAGTYLSSILRADLKNSVVESWFGDPDDPTSDPRFETLSLYPAEAGKLWVATFNSGLKLFHPETGRFQTFTTNPANASALRSKSIQKLLLDNSGQLWVATGGGLHRLIRNETDHLQTFHSDTTRKGSLNNAYVWSVFEDREGTVWVGTSKGLNHFNPENQTFTEYDIAQKNKPSGFVSYALLAICEAPSGEYLWLGTFGAGLYRFHKRTGRLQNFDIADLANGNRDLNMIYDVISDLNGKMLWLATEYGVQRFNTVTHEVLPPPSGKQEVAAKLEGHIHALHPGVNGSLWIGTLGNGMYQWIPSDSIYKNWRKGDAGLRTNSITDFATVNVDSGRAIWVSTSGDGLSRIDLVSNQTFRLNEDNGLTSNTVLRLFADQKGGVWATTEANLIYIDPGRETFESYAIPNSSEGTFPFSNFAGCIAGDGTLWSGGPKGLLKLHPEQFRTAKKIPELQFTEFRVFDRPVSIGPDQPVRAAYSDELNLSWRDNLFSIEFSLMDYRETDRARYFYKLDGFHEDFVASRLGNRVEFTNLDPGKYTLHVRGVNGSGGEATRQMSIIITPPFWDTWWFRSLVIVLITALLYGLHRYRLNQLLKVERTRTRIARDLHDEISANLSSINFFSDAVARNDGEELSESARKYLGLIAESASGARSAMDDIIWAINPQSDDWGSFLARLRRFASDLLASRNIDYDIRIPEQNLAEKISMEMQRDLWLIFKEIITNAVRHSECSHIEIEAVLDRRRFLLVVRDDGKGFDEQGRSDRNGLSNIRSRALDLGATTELQTAVGQGTVWEIELRVS